MKLNGKKISNNIIRYVLKDITILKKKSVKKPRLVVFSIKPNQEDYSFINSKKKAAKKAGIQFELIVYKKTPRFEDFANRIKEESNKKTTTSVIIQKPLPSSLSTITLYNYIPDYKEIEGIRPKSLFIPPIGLAVLCVLKTYYLNDISVRTIIPDLKEDISLYKNVLKRKQIVLLGRGETGGAPIGKTLTQAKINYINIHSKTPNPSYFIKNADIIISAVGKSVIDPLNIKDGVALISVGIRKEKERWIGDFWEEEVKSKASFYTPTPGGIGPVDIAFLMYNVLRSFKLQY